MGLDFSFLNDTEQYQTNVMMNVEQQSYIKRLDDLGKILSVNFTGEDESSQFCSPYYQGVTIHQAPSGFISLVHEFSKKDIDELGEEDLYRGYNEKLSSYAVSPLGISILSSKGKVYFIDTNSKDMSFFNYTLPLLNEHQQSTQLVYDERSRYFYAFLNDNSQVLKYQFLNNEIQHKPVAGWQTPTDKMRVVASNGWLYSAQESQGLFIYEIQLHGLKFIKSFTSMDLYDSQKDLFRIIDVAVYEDKLYVLDYYNGITQFNIHFDGTFTKNEKLGLIKYSDCKSFSVRGSTIILIQSYQSNSEIVELFIQDDNYLEMRKIYTKSQLRRADILDDDFAIIRGLHDHKIMLIQMPEQYLDQDAKRLDNYFFSGNLLGVNKLGKNNETLFAISPHGFYVFIYRAYPTIIICNSNNVESGLYQANMQIKSTDCDKKTDKQNHLQYCITNHLYNFEIKKPLLSPEQQQITIYLTIILISIILLLVGCILFHCRSYQIKLENLERSKRRKHSKPPIKLEA
ncbi:unnamed protein product (macronuclear) [Paramecium tetraurelia]|uniref:Transmembrane protein n=1 Tax=Paramecium tetraurelia TaxID=5888 RepID=A0BRC1_PARTE|nr:uncharacterized protein GSPATT00031319001 [Paramecium tetraurelia]CAK61088.1 unnamed protein product [Paramecium tetraurelia]|eukprot:XP_001428486.1 hypothetical protein (macronuclear) [Paramecium tetraurelia strain d4-2]